MTEADQQSAAEARTRSTNRKIDRLIALLRRHLNIRPGAGRGTDPGPRARGNRAPRAASTRQRGNPQPICRATGPDKYRAASQAATV